jgi:hypothetical protein
LVLNEEKFLEFYNDQYYVSSEVSLLPRLENTFHKIHEDFTIYLLAFEGIYMEKSIVSAPKIGMCAPEIDLKDSKIDASGKGCISGEGRGKGLQTG